MGQSGVVSRLSVEKCLSQSAGNFRRESFTVALFSSSEKKWIGGWEYQDFPSEISCLTVPKASVGESCTVALISGNEIVWIRRGVNQGFPSKSLGLTVPIISVGETYTVALILGIEKVWIRVG